MDITRDRNFKTFVKLARRMGSDLPKYVADYTADTEKIASELPDEEFACPALRMYPVDSKASTWLSALYAAGDLELGSYKEAQAAQDAIPFIKSSAAVWGILDDVDKVFDELPVRMHKRAEDRDENYGWIDRDENGNTIARRYGIFDESGVFKAAEHFLLNRDHYHYRTREKVANFILRKAAEYGISSDRLSKDLEKEAGYGIPVKSLVMEELTERARLAKHADCAKLIENVNTLLEVSDPEELPSAMDKVATLVHEFDLAEGLTERYGKGVLRPSEFFHVMDGKTAEDIHNRALQLGDHMFDYVKLAENVPAQEFYRVLGPGFVNKVAESGEFDEDKPDNQIKISAHKLRDELSKLKSSKQRELVNHITSLCS